MTLTYFERGKLQGEADGERKALLRTALRLLEAQFGPPSAAAKERLEALSTAQLDMLLLGVLKAKSLKALGLED